MGDLERFRRSFKKDENGCWIWLRSSCCGYGMFKCENTLISAHRYSYKTFVGKLTPPLYLDHLCNNPSCVNPDHLEQVTGSKNTQRAYDRKNDKNYPANFFKKKNNKNYKRIVKILKMYEII